MNTAIKKKLNIADKVIKHLKKDTKDFKKQIKEDTELTKSLKQNKGKPCR